MTHRSISDDMNDVLDILLDLEGVRPRPEMSDKAVILALSRAVYNLQEIIVKLIEKERSDK